MKHQNLGISGFTAPSPFKVTEHLKFSLKKYSVYNKNKSNTSSYYSKNVILSLQERSLMFFKQTYGCNVKQKLFRQIQAYSSIFEAYSSIFQNYSGILGTVFNPGIFRMLAYSELLAHSEPAHNQYNRRIQNHV